jgi:hypothetical protein
MCNPKYVVKDISLLRMEMLVEGGMKSSTASL